MPQRLDLGQWPLWRLCMTSTTDAQSWSCLCAASFLMTSQGWSLLLLTGLVETVSHLQALLVSRKLKLPCLLMTAGLETVVFDYI